MDETQEFLTRMRSVGGDWRVYAGLRRPLSVSEQIAETVKDLILTGEIESGSRVLEEDLAQRFGVSRAPVRDALRILNKLGLIELMARRGAMVRILSVTQIVELYEVRAELFSLACRKASGRIEKDVKATIEVGLSLLATAVESGDVQTSEWLEIRNAIASPILIAAENRCLVEQIEFLGMQAVSHSRAFETVTHRRRNLKLWREVFDSIFAGDGQKAADLGRKLVVESGAELVRQLGREQKAADEGQ